MRATGCFRFVFSALLAGFLTACGGSGTAPASIAGAWEFLIVGGSCPDLSGVLNPGEGPPAVFQVTQSGLNVSSQFVDQVGGSGTLDAQYSGDQVRGSLEVAQSGRTLRASVEGYARVIRGQRQVDGWARIEFDSDEQCLGEIIEFCAIIDGDAGEPVLQQCPAVDIVFVMDTSGSMEDEAAALCLQLPGVEDDLRSRGLQTIRTAIFGITETTTISETGSFAESPQFDCLTDTVVRRLGTAVPGPGGTTVDTLDPFEDESEEFWAPATAIVADRYPWLPDGALPTIRIIVPISDESPRTGDNECAPADFESVSNAINVALENAVIVSPIIGFLSGQDACIPLLGQNLADATGGVRTFTSDPTTDLAGAIFDLVVAACEGGPPSPPPPPPPPTEPGEFEDCPPIEIVFLMDTSGSMVDDSRALCDNILTVVAQLEAEGADVSYTILGITENQSQALARLEADRQAFNATVPPALQVPPLPANTFDCLSDSVLNQLGGTVPVVIQAAEVIDFDNPINAQSSLPHYESWASATAIVAERFPWDQPTGFGPAPIRVIVPMSDEGPELGLSFFDVELNATIYADRGDCDDRDYAAMDNAIAVAQQNGVIVSPITAFLADLLADPTGQTGQFHPCVVDEGDRIANATGGTRFSSRNPAADLSTILLGIVESACESVGPRELVAFDRNGDMYFVNPATGENTFALDTFFVDDGNEDLDVISSALWVPARSQLWIGGGGSGNSQGIIWSLNTVTGEASLALEVIGFTYGVASLALRPNGDIYFPEGDSDEIYRIDSNLDVTYIGDADGSSGRALTFVGDDLYIADDESLYRLDPDTAAPTLIGDFTLVGFPALSSYSIGSMTTRPGDNAVFAILKEHGGGGSNSSSRTFLARIDLATAQVTNIGVNSTRLDGLAFVPASLFVEN